LKILKKDRSNSEYVPKIKKKELSLLRFVKHKVIYFSRSLYTAVYGEPNTLVKC